MPDDDPLVAALRAMREVVVGARFPLDHGDATLARRWAGALVAQLDDYLIPRAQRLDAPVLAVVGGSTGAGKSTLFNSLLRAPVSPAGALRPTTRGPVLACHPADTAWFGDSAEVISAPQLAPGLALLDAPDIDSVVAQNRRLALELLAAADLWLFVTTAARYADAVPWQALRGARDRGTVVAVVLNRVATAGRGTASGGEAVRREAVRDEISADLSRLLSEQGLPAATLLVVEESPLDGQGLLPVNQVADVAAYLAEVGGSDARRRTVARRSLFGAVTAAAETVDELARVATDQGAVADALTATVHEAYRRAQVALADQLAAGVVLRGGAYARFGECLANGELARALRAVQDPERARPTPTPPARAVQVAVATALAALITVHQTLAADDIVDRWGSDPAGRPLLADEPAPGSAWDVIDGWQEWLRGAAGRTGARAATAAATVVLATLAVAAPGTAAADDDLVRRILNDPTVRSLAQQGRAELLDRVSAHFARQAAQWVDRVAAARADPDQASRLRQSGAQLGIARQLAIGAVTMLPAKPVRAVASTKRRRAA